MRVVNHRPKALASISTVEVGPIVLMNRWVKPQQPKKVKMEATPAIWK